MFLGHSAIGFTAGILIGLFFTQQNREAVLIMGILGAVFGFIPDVDIITGVVFFVQALVTEPTSIWNLVDVFWETANSTHRSVTHSLLTAPLVGLLVYTYTSEFKRFAVTIGFVGVLLISVASSFAYGAITALFVSGCVIVAEVTIRHTTLTPRNIALPAAAGLFLHPFGDLLTGAPPEFLYPVYEFGFSRIELFADPTLNLLVAGLTEVAALWAGLVLFGVFSETEFREKLPAYGSIGFLMGLAPFYLPPPTMEVSYHIVIPIIFTAFLLAASIVLRADGYQRDAFFNGTIVGMTSITLGFMSYLLVYLFI